MHLVESIWTVVFHAVCGSVTAAVEQIESSGCH